MSFNFEETPEEKFEINKMRPLEEVRNNFKEEDFARKFIIPLSPEIYAAMDQKWGGYLNPNA